MNESPEEETNRLRKLHIPDRASSEEEYEALRAAHRDSDLDPDISVSFWEQTVVDTAAVFEQLDADAQRLLRILHQPSPDHGVVPEDVYPDAVGEPHFPAEGAWISLDDVHCLLDASRDVRKRLESEDGDASTIRDAELETADDTEGTDGLNRVRAFLSRVEEFCEMTLEIGVRPKIRRN